MGDSDRHGAADSALSGGRGRIGGDPAPVERGPEERARPLPRHSPPQSLNGSNTSRPAMATPIGRSVWITRTESWW